MVKAQHGITLEPAQKQALLDEARRSVDERDSMHLRLAAACGADTGCVEYGDDTPKRVVNGRGGAGEADVPRSEMIRLVNGDGTRLGCTGAYAIGSLAFFTPFGTNDQACLDEHPLERRVDLLAQDDA